MFIVASPRGSLCNFFLFEERTKVHSFLFEREKTLRFRLNQIRIQSILKLSRAGSTQTSLLKPPSTQQIKSNHNISSSSSYPVYPAHSELRPGSGEGKTAATHNHKGNRGQRSPSTRRR